MIIKDFLGSRDHDTSRYLLTFKTRGEMSYSVESIAEYSNDIPGFPSQTEYGLGSSTFFDQRNFGLEVPLFIAVSRCSGRGDEVGGSIDPAEQEAILRTAVPGLTCVRRPRIRSFSSIMQVAKQSDPRVRSCARIVDKHGPETIQNPETTRIHRCRTYAVDKSLSKNNMRL